MVKCSNCTEEGHNKRTCPQIKEVLSKELTEKKSKVSNKKPDKLQDNKLDKIPDKIPDKLQDKIPNKILNKVKKNEKKEKIIEEVKFEKIIWNQFKIENIPTTKKDATLFVKQIYIDWDILSKLAEEVHEYDEYYGSSPNEWRIKPEILINEKKVDYTFLWNNYLEQYEHIVKCYDLYQKGEKILMKVF
jgi:hypothetical protein